MLNRFFILLLLAFGIFIMPNAAMACGKTGGSCCDKKEKNEAAKTAKKTCRCGKKTSKTSENKEKGDCDGKCGNDSCHCQQHSIDINLPSNHLLNIEPSSITVCSASLRPNEPLMRSFDYKFLWLIPKIS